MTPPTLDTRNVNALWAGVMVETLVRCGVRHVVISPGSRSTPLTFAFARHEEIEAVPVLDERSAAFLALGMAKRTGVPVVLLCTSGTAGANYFPAVIEARESAVPLLVLTADRPPEMRACASGQTIDQQKLFGDYVRFFHELTVPEATEPRLRYLRQTTANAITRTLQPHGGPVHLNVPFRDPLPPIDDGGATAQAVAGIDWKEFFAHLGAPRSVLRVGEAPRFPVDVHGVIVVGPTQPAEVDRYVVLVGELAKRLGWPVLSDGLSPLRSNVSAVPYQVSCYDAILRNSALAERLKPERVLCLGDWPTSKVLRGWIEASGARIWQLTDRADNRDALHGRTEALGISLAAFVESLPPASEPNGYERMWARYEQAARTTFDAWLAAETAMFEPKAAWLLAQHLPEGTPGFVASSMPVRDVEYVWPVNDRRVQLYVNRGANGIDGTLSTALGIAHSEGQAAFLLTGDLALLHDTNGFLHRPKLRGSLTIVLINNRGGGIFGHLPVAQFEPPFEEYFATPQEVDFAQLAAAYGVEHVLVKDWAHFAELVSMPPVFGIRILEVKTDRKRDAEQRKRWFAAVAANLK